MLYDDPDATGYYMSSEDGKLQRFDRPGTGLRVYGMQLGDAFLWVGTPQMTAKIKDAAKHTISLSIRDGDKALFDYDIRIDLVVERLAESGKLVPVVAVDEDGRYTGRVLLARFYVGEEYNGRHFTVCFTTDGATTESSGIVEDGYISFMFVNNAGSITVELEP